MPRFKAVSDEDRKSRIILVRANNKDWEAIRFAAKIRNLTVSDFVRRAALGRKADVHYESQIVLALREATDMIRVLHAQYVSNGHPPPEDVLGLVIDRSVEAMSRINK